MKYYYFPNQVFSLMLIELFILAITVLISQVDQRRMVTFVIFFILIFTLGKISFTEAMREHRVLLSESALVGYVLSHNWHGYTVYSSIDHFERNHKLFLYFTQWTENSDNIRYIPSMDNWFAESFANTEYHSDLSKKSIREFFSHNSSSSVLVIELDLGNRTEISNDKKILCGSSPFSRKICTYAIYLRR